MPKQIIPSQDGYCPLAHNAPSRFPRVPVAPVSWCLFNPDLRIVSRHASSWMANGNAGCHSMGRDCPVSLSWGCNRSVCFAHLFRIRSCSPVCPRVKEYKGRLCTNLSFVFRRVVTLCTPPDALTLQEVHQFFCQASTLRTRARGAERVGRRSRSKSLETRRGHVIGPAQNALRLCKSERAEVLRRM